MYWFGMDRRSDNDCGESAGEAADSSLQRSDTLRTAAILLLMFVLPLVPFLVLIVRFVSETYSRIRTAIKSTKPPKLFLVFGGVLLAAILAFGLLQLDHSRSPLPTYPPTSTGTATAHLRSTPTSSTRSFRILVDDFRPQPYPGASVYYYNRLGGDRGAVNNSILDWGRGQVTTTISSGDSWGGVWMSLNHPRREALPIDFSAALPPQILPAYQSQITGITTVIVDGTPGRTFRLELKDRGELRWKEELVLEGERQVVRSDLPALGDTNELLWVLDNASAGDFVVLESVSLTARTQITDTAMAAFAWSYGMLLNNWNPATGLVRDKAKYASGEFDAIQATGSLAAATAVAQELGVISRTDALQIVNRISDTLILELPRFHGLWPHWVTVSPAGGITIVPGTEWSSLDTVIAALGLLVAQSALRMDTSGTEQLLQAIDWDDLIMPRGISHGYMYAGDPIPHAWDVFGGESWLINLAYAGATGQAAPMAYAAPPTANGSGFIDELAWLFVPPPSGQDYWGTDWSAYRVAAGEKQLLYYTTHARGSCFSQLGLFGLSAAEVPDPWLVPPEAVYRAFGVGGRFSSASDGSELLGVPVIVPHYAALVSSLRPEEAQSMWDWLMDHGLFSPLTNPESLMFTAGSDCDPDKPVWNHLKGSWNLSLQALGWGRYLAEGDGRVPVLWQATTASPLLRRGYEVLAPEGAVSTPEQSSTSVETSMAAFAEELPMPIAVYAPQPHETPATPIWENARSSCGEKPLYAWSSPGTYTYRITGSSGAVQLAVERKTGNQGPVSYYYSCTQLEADITSSAPNFGEALTEPPKVGSSREIPSCRPPRAVVAGHGTMSTEVVGIQTKRTNLGAFPAVRVDTNIEYSFTTGLHDTFDTEARKSEWYVCGYGLVHSTARSTEMKNRMPLRQKSSEVKLISYTPISTNESRVRHILVDAQLSENIASYRAKVTDEESAEALRRWDAGIRVVNIGEFERKVVDGHWRIVYAGTDDHVMGTDIILTTDSSQ